MSKRPIDMADSINAAPNAPPEKKNKFVTEQIVLMKREFQKGAARIDNTVIYKLDCKTLNKKQQNLVYVETKEMYDAIEINCSYKFTVERRGRRWYLIDFEKNFNICVELKSTITSNDFVNELEAYVNFFVLGAYLTYDIIKIFGYVNVDDELKQCDLIVKLSGTSCFDFTSDENIVQRIQKGLTKIYNNYLNKWCVFHVVCKNTFNNNCSMYVKDNSSVQDSDVCDDINNLTTNNISYTTNKCFKLSQINSISKCEQIVTEKSSRIVFEMLLSNDEMLNASKFDVPANTIVEVISDVNSINFEIEVGSKFFCVYAHKLNEDKPYINLISILGMDEDNVVTSLI